MHGGPAAAATGQVSSLSAEVDLPYLMTANQFTFDAVMAATEAQRRPQGRSGTFTDNMKLPVHRWFRYSAGFSADWVMETIADFVRTAGPKCRILDPFVGSGTTLLAAEGTGHGAVGWEVHPFIWRVAQAKLLWHLDPEQLVNCCVEVSVLAEKAGWKKGHHSVPDLLERCYSEDTLKSLKALGDAYAELATDDPHWELVWLAITAILRTCSFAGTAQWQYVLPNKRKLKSVEPHAAFRQMIALMAGDMRRVQDLGYRDSAILLRHDARSRWGAAGQFDLVVTSPPYPNNYDYADATRLEMTFWGEIRGWADLHDAVRKYLITSCSQHSAKDKLDPQVLLADAELSPLGDRIGRVVEKLGTVRLERGGKKTYHTMIAQYFIDMSLVWKSLRSSCCNGARICYVIGDSAPYGVYVPVDEWLGQLALAAGFNSFSFEKIRDRNVKWRNRKHRVPLKEGRLWVEG
ncbi:MAG: hypothetical protein OXG13_10560 [Gemmatimonadaceae bacterium]|nr:hypothetical protein [Gemmatimonadaceae bacterium]